MPLSRLGRASIAASDIVEDVDATLGASDAADVEEDDDHVDNDDADSDEDVSSTTTGVCDGCVHVALEASAPNR